MSGRPIKRTLRVRGHEALPLREEVHALEEGLEAWVGAEGPHKSEETTQLETADRQEMSAQSNGVRHNRDVAYGYTRSPT